MTGSKSSLQILKKLLAFSVPLILSGLLQQLFSWVDALIVGNVIGEHALAAVGATSSVSGLFITVFAGFTSGLSILFAQQYGQQPRENARLLALFAYLLAAVFTLAAIGGTVFIRPILLLMDTPDALYEDARSYLSIIFLGIPFLAVYNTFSAALRGMGNSRVPFLAVLICSVLNGVLDYWFIVFLGMGIAGAAAATTLSRAAMTLFIIGYTLLRHPELRLLPGDSIFPALPEKKPRLIKLFPPPLRSRELLLK